MTWRLLNGLGWPKRWVTLLALMLMAMPVVAAAQFGSVIRTTDSTITCKDVTTTSVAILAANTGRTQYSIVTTAGAAVIFVREGAAATANGAASYRLTGGNTYTDDGNVVYSGSINVITASGTVHVCAKEN